MNDQRLSAKPLLDDLLDTLGKLHPSEGADGKVDSEVARQSLAKIKAFQKALCVYVEQASWMSSCTNNSNRSVWIIYRLAQMQKAFHNLGESVAEALSTGRFKTLSTDGRECEVECFLNVVSCSGRKAGHGDTSEEYLGMFVGYADELLDTDMGNLSQFNSVAMNAVVEGAVTEDEAFFLFLINCEYSCFLYRMRIFQSDAERKMIKVKQAA